MRQDNVRIALHGLEVFARESGGIIVGGYKAARLERRTVANRDRPLTVLMLGSSRTAYGFRASALEDRLAAGG